MTIFDKNGYILIAFLSVTLHECAHIAAMKIFGAELRSVGFEPFGIVVKKEKYALSGKAALIVSAAGCTVNFVIGAVMLLIYLFVKKKFILNVSAVNFLLFAVNVLPVKNLDGGDVMHLFLAERTSPEKALKAEKAVSLCVCALMFTLGIIIWVKVGFNPTLFILSLYLAFSAFTSVPD